MRKEVFAPVLLLLFAMEAHGQGTPGILRCALSSGIDLHARNEPSSPVIAKLKCGAPVLLIDDRHVRTEDGKDGFILGVNFGQWSLEPTPEQVVPSVSASSSVTTRETRIETPVAASTMTATDRINPTSVSLPAKPDRSAAAVEKKNIVASSGVRVYVFSQEKEGGFTDLESKRRTDSVNDIRKALAKRKGFAVVETPDMAQLLLEVTISGEVETDPVSESRRTRDIADAILGTSHVETKTVRQTKPTLVSALRIPGSTYTINFAYQGGFWGVMADRIVDQFEKWVQMNRARLEAR